MINIGSNNSNKKESSNSKKPADTVDSRAHRHTTEKQGQFAHQCNWNSGILKSSCPLCINSYRQEVRKAIYGNTNGHPASGSAKYCQFAENYAIYGEDFLDFPKNLTSLLEEDICTPKEVEACAAPAAPAAPKEREVVRPTDFGKSPSAFSYNYQPLIGAPLTVRPITHSASSYGLFKGYKLTQAGATSLRQVYPPTRNFIRNSLVDVPLAWPTQYPINPIMPTNTHHYCNTFIKETQYLNAAMYATTDIYGRMTYPHLNPQQMHVYSHMQQRSTATTTMLHNTHQEFVRVGCLQVMPVKQQYK